MKIVLGFGSNLGDRKNIILQAYELLEEKLENEFEIITVKHYSYRGCNKDCYKKHILSKIFK